MKIPLIPPSEEPNSMSAMTDVVFLLLIFFIVTMSGYAEMTLLETNLPTGSGASGNVDLQKIVKIEISPEGSYTVNDTVQSPESMQKFFARYARLMPDAEFLIGCSPEAKHYLLVSLLANLAKHNLKNVKLLK